MVISLKKIKNIKSLWKTVDIYGKYERSEVN